MGDHCCCCHIVTFAAIVGVLQLTIIVSTMASSGTVLDRWRLWRDEAQDMGYNKLMNLDLLKKIYPSATPPTALKDKINEKFKMMENSTLEPAPAHEPMFEIEMAEHIGACAVWLVALFVYAAAFKYYRAVFVLPNLVLQTTMLILTLIFIAGVASGAAVRADNDQEMKRRHFFYVLLAGAVVAWIAQLFFTVILFKFYKYLKATSGMVVFPNLPILHKPASP